MTGPGRSPCATTAATCYSLVCLYHDTMPKPDYAPTWPESIPGVGDYDNLDRLIEEGWLLCGNPEEVAEQLARYQEVGCDQVVFGLPSDSMEHEEVLEMLEVFGTKVIPEFDKDEVHSTTRYRATAQRKYPDFASDVPDIEVPGLPDQRPHPAGRHPQVLTAPTGSGPTRRRPDATATTSASPCWSPPTEDPVPPRSGPARPACSGHRG